MGGGVHWWLQNSDGDILDITSSQFDESLDYSSGRCGGFLSKKPSKRSQLLMERAYNFLEGGYTVDMKGDE